MPGGVPRTSTLALNKATIPFTKSLANKGYQTALNDDPNFMDGLNIFKGQITYKAIADDLGYEFVSPQNALN